jgi:hypothetical protein
MSDGNAIAIRIGMLGSDYDGEVVAAVKALKRAQRQRAQLLQPWLLGRVAKEGDAPASKRFRDGVSADVRTADS